jgi:valyl-tRNA synthetase
LKTIPDNTIVLDIKGDFMKSYLHETERFIINEALDRLLSDMKKDPENVRKPFDEMIEMCTDYAIPESWDSYIENAKNKFNKIESEKSCESEVISYKTFEESFGSDID